ncbi:putative tetratricopeptide repeat-containing domain protein [Trichinella spiralis]|uniref:Protein HGV2 n=1 Tax=Trichinella spiralis TaxID=6334 RepID=E5SFY3_TRISP|nr:putative tetratricopeptide repeat-containing domain protein [Trichinella spiralis]KRY42457.1 Protein HGV2 [Trichinella spiralis]
MESSSDAHLTSCDASDKSEICKNDHSDSMNEKQNSAEGVTESSHQGSGQDVVNKEEIDAEAQRLFDLGKRALVMKNMELAVRHMSSAIELWSVERLKFMVNLMRSSLHRTCCTVRHCWTFTWPTAETWLLREMKGDLDALEENDGCGTSNDEVKMEQSSDKQSDESNGDEEVKDEEGNEKGSADELMDEEEDEKANGEDETANGEEAEGAANGEDEEDVDDLQLAWEAIETARVGLIRLPTSLDNLARLGSCHVLLAEIASENGHFDDAITSISQAYSVFKEILPKHDRRIANWLVAFGFLMHLLLSSVHCLKGANLEMSNKFEEAKKCFEAAIESLELRKKHLEDVLKEELDSTERLKVEEQLEQCIEYRDSIRNRMADVTQTAKFKLADVLVKEKTFSKQPMIAVDDSEVDTESLIVRKKRLATTNENTVGKVPRLEPEIGESSENKEEKEIQE